VELKIIRPRIELEFMVGIGELLVATRMMWMLIDLILMRMVILNRIDGRIEAMGERKSGAQILWRVVTSSFHSCPKRKSVQGASSRWIL
jgi:hypothetical protein